MSKNALIGIVLAVVVIGGGAWWFASQDTATPVVVDTSTIPSENTNVTPTPDVASPTTPTDTTPAPAPTPGTYTMAQVSTHNSAASCWSVIDGKVYDLTNWISQHPGGEQAIKGLCGKDGTAAFHGQHGDAKKQADMLATMKIGVLAQ